MGGGHRLVAGAQHHAGIGTDHERGVEWDTPRRLAPGPDLLDRAREPHQIPVRGRERGRLGGAVLAGDAPVARDGQQTDEDVQLEIGRDLGLGLAGEVEDEHLLAGERADIALEIDPLLERAEIPPGEQGAEQEHGERGGDPRPAPRRAAPRRAPAAWAASGPGR
jgi:hypothetical protein